MYRIIDEGLVTYPPDEMEDATILSEESFVDTPPALEDLVETEEEYHELMRSRDTQIDLDKQICIDEFGESIYACSKQLKKTSGRAFDPDAELCIKKRAKFGYCVHANFHRRAALYYCPLQIRKWSDCNLKYPREHGEPHPQCASIHWRMKTCFSSAHETEKDKYRRSMDRTVDHSIGAYLLDAAEHAPWAIWFGKYFLNPELVSRDWTHINPDTYEHWKQVHN